MTDRRSDVYSLGVILFEMLTGERPFRGNLRMLVHQVINDEAPSPRRLNSAVPRDLETICLTCLRTAPGRRYATAFDLAEDLRRAIGNEPIKARPLGQVEKTWLWCRRKPAVAGLVGAMTLLIIGAIVVPQYVVYIQRVAITEKNLRLAETLVEKSRGG